jgi:hypothetical protein
MSYLWLMWNKNAGRLLFWTTVMRRTAPTTRISCPNPRMETVRFSSFQSLFVSQFLCVLPIYWFFLPNSSFFFSFSSQFPIIFRSSLTVLSFYAQFYIVCVSPYKNLLISVNCALTESQSVCICVCLSGHLCMFLSNSIEDLYARTPMGVREQGKGLRFIRTLKLSVYACDCVCAAADGHLRVGWCWSGSRTVYVLQCTLQL